MLGKFVTFEGPEGGGKSSVIREVIGAFSGSVDILGVREPGSTTLGEKIRGILQTEEMPDRSELMLFEAARACIVDTVIKPALDRGTSVACDRFSDSTVAYQGYGRGLPFRDIDSMNRIATTGLTPDLTILLDIDPMVGMARKGKPSDRIESAGMDFHVRVRKGFLEMAEANPGRFRVVDASKPLEEVVEAVVGVLKVNFGWKRSRKQTKE